MKLPWARLFEPNYVAICIDDNDDSNVGDGRFDGIVERHVSAALHSAWCYDLLMINKKNNWVRYNTL